MKRSKMKVEEILKMMLDPENLPERSSSTPTSLEERVSVGEQVRKLAELNSDNICTVCIGCGESTPLLKSAPCACGGFVCAACQKLEEEGICNHEMFNLLKDE